MPLRSSHMLAQQPADTPLMTAGVHFYEVIGKILTRMKR
jgi:hypothetical protein